MKEAFLSGVKEYFGWTENREPEGFLSPAHLAYVTAMVAFAVFLAVRLGKKYRSRTEEEKLRVLKNAAVTMVSCELIKIVLISFRSHDAYSVRGMLPLFLCSLLLITLPLAAFSKGSLQKTALMNVFIYGPVCCLGGTYLAANYFGGSPVLSFDPMMSVTTHCIGGFSAAYIAASRLYVPERKTMLGALRPVAVTEALALLANRWNKDTAYEENYMFLSDSAGTPFSILESLTGEDPVLYAAAVCAVYLLWGLLFTFVFLRVKK